MATSPKRFVTLFLLPAEGVRTWLAVPTIVQLSLELSLSFVKYVDASFSVNISPFYSQTTFESPPAIICHSDGITEDYCRKAFMRSCDKVTLYMLSELSQQLPYTM